MDAVLKRADKWAATLILLDPIFSDFQRNYMRSLRSYTDLPLKVSVKLNF